MLHVQDLHAWYGQSHVLQGVSFTVQPGEIVALLGRNGSGRSTTAKAIMGLVKWDGTLQWKDQNLQGCEPHTLALAGVGYVPEGRDVFPGLTVEQNLLLGRKRGAPNGSRSLCDLYARFPTLQQRRHTAAGVLSGGEQQMLTLCRTLMGQPELIIIDEPTEGLAPALVQEVSMLIQTLKRSGVAVLLIEQKRTIALHIANRVLVMGQGRIVFDGAPAQLQTEDELCRQWLGV